MPVFFFFFLMELAARLNSVNALFAKAKKLIAVVRKLCDCKNVILCLTLFH